MAKRRLILNDTQLPDSSGGVQSVTAGTGITISGTASDPIVNSNSDIEAQTQSGGTSVLSLVPQSGSFSVNNSQSTIRIKRIGSTALLNISFATSALTIGTASGNLKLVINQQLIRDVLDRTNYNASMGAQVINLRYNSAQPFVNPPVWVAYSTTAYELLLSKNSGNAQDIGTQSLSQVSDLTEHSSGFRNVLLIDMYMDFR
jgi:hypothetical protein